MFYLVYPCHYAHTVVCEKHSLKVLLIVHVVAWFSSCIVLFLTSMLINTVACEKHSLKVRVHACSCGVFGERGRSEKGANTINTLTRWALSLNLGIGCIPEHTHPPRRSVSPPSFAIYFTVSV